MAPTPMRPVLLVSAATFIIFFQGFMVAPLLPVLSSHFGVSVRHVSFIEPGYLLGYGAFTLVYAPLSDRFGRGRIILLSLLLFCLFTLLTAFAQNIHQMLLLRVLAGMGAAGVAPTTIGWIGDTYPYEKRGHALGIFFGFMAGGTAFGSSIGALISARAGWPFLFECVAAAGLLIAAMIFLQHRRLFPPTASGSTSARQIFRSFREILAQKRARWTYGYVLFNGMFHSGVFAWLGYYFYRRYALTEMQVGLALLGYGVPGFLLGAALGKLVDRYGRRRIIPIGLGISACAVLLLSRGPSLPMACLLVTVLSLGFDLSHPLFAAIVTTFSARKGAATGLFALFLFSGYGLGSLLLSLIVGIGLDKSFLLYGSAALLAAVISLHAFRHET